MNNLYPKRILHVVGAMNRAGTETMLMNLYRNINRDKLQFDFISYGPDAHYDEEIRKLGGRIFRLSKTQSIKEIYHVIKKKGPFNAVHSHTLFHSGTAITAAKLAGLRIRISHAHTTLDRSDVFTRKIYIGLMRRAINAFSTNLLACSNEAGRYLFGEKSLSKSKYSFFPNLINYTGLLTEPIGEVKRFKAEQGLEDSVVLGHIGRFTESKNHMFILDILRSALQRNNNCKLLLVGDGKLKMQTEEQARKYGIYDKIRFLGIRNDIPALLHSMDVFVFPSVHEGLGLVLLEAQASGLPCIVSESIQPEADLKIGLVSRLCLADSASTWAGKILELAGKKEKNTKKIIKGFEANGYSIASCVSRLMRIYNLASEDV